MTPLFQKMILASAFVVSIFATTQSHAEYYTCYEQEYRCETSYEQDCRSERSCYTVPGQQQCSQERVCKIRSEPPRCERVEECGTNALGEPICKIREVCSGGGSVEECGYEQRCYNTPGREECSYQNVCENRPVQRCGYENVAKTCYRPDPTPVDPTPVDPTPWPVNPTPVDPTPWPVDPTPVDPTPWPVDPTPVDPTPINPAPELGQKSIQKVIVTVKEAQSVLTFKDKAQSPTYRTRYFISIYDASGDLVLNQFSSEKGENQKITLNKVLSAKQRYRLVLKVQRSGGELVREVEFTKVLDF